VAIIFFVAVNVFAADWVIVLRDGTTITCNGPYMVVDGVYQCSDRKGNSKTLRAAEVDASKTAAANAERTTSPNGEAKVASPNGSASVSGPKTGDFLISFDGPFPPPAVRNRHIDYQLKPSQETYFVRIPNSYTGARPYGLIVFVHAGDQINSVPPGWADVLDENNLLFVAAQASGNDHPVGRRLGLAVLGALEMKTRFNVDPMRIYTAGFSGGARMSNALAFFQSDLFKGTIQNCGADFFKRVPRREATESDPYGFALADATTGEIERARRTVRFVLITGAGDFRRGNILDIYNYGYGANGFYSKLLDVPGMGHDVCDGLVLAQAIAFLESH
jgi:hypothetical protein